MKLVPFLENVIYLSLLTKSIRDFFFFGAMSKQRDLLQYSIVMDRTLPETKISLSVLPSPTGK